MVGRARALLPLLPALLVLGCGGGDDDSAGEAEVRECLADNGLAVEAAAPAGSALGGASADFRASADRLAVDVIVERDDEHAERKAAALRGALATLGVADVEQRLLQHGNAIAVFSAEPEAEEREAVIGCLG